MGSHSGCSKELRAFSIVAEFSHLDKQKIKYPGRSKKDQFNIICYSRKHSLLKMSRKRGKSAILKYQLGRKRKNYLNRDLVKCIYTLISCMLCLLHVELIIGVCIPIITNFPASMMIVRKNLIIGVYIPIILKCTYT